jgi:peroxiredoxin
MLKELLIDNDVISDQIRKYSQDYGVYHKKRRLREIKKLKLKKREKYLIDDLKQR